VIDTRPLMIGPTATRGDGARAMTQASHACRLTAKASRRRPQGTLRIIG
jgi:hypothetical protein